MVGLEQGPRRAADGSRPDGFGRVGSGATREGEWTWQHLDAVERLDIPADLEVAMAAQPGAAGHFAAFPPSTRRAILGWIAAARRPATRAARITETAMLAGRNERANQRRPKP
jgi:uncharacterized protein YdeI (YjbR/CyaY-like superfamily)